jgi:prepilin-type N-terminal cleavage/methylation domain-containing protein
MIRQPSSTAARRSGFTLIELLITVGIIALLTGLALVGILAANKHARKIRITSDFGLIDTALSAYKAESWGDFPRFADPATDQSVTTGQWMDYSQSRGAVLLCRALIGPDAAAIAKIGTVVNGSSTQVTVQGDGADGPGFRTRVNVNTATGAYSGKVYGAYLDASKFKLSLIAMNDSAGNNYYDYVMLDINGNPILYYPGKPGPAMVSQAGGYDAFVDPSQYSTSSGTALPEYNAYDNAAFLPKASFMVLMGDTKQDGAIDTAGENPATNAPYLLWSAGADGVFGFVPPIAYTPGSAPGGVPKTDDITNFGIPSQYQK